MSWRVSALLCHMSSLLLYGFSLSMFVGFVYLVQSTVFTFTGAHEDWRSFEIALQEWRDVPNPRTGLVPSKLFVARVWRHYQTKTSLNKKIENHNFLKIAESLILTFSRCYNQELKNEYLNAIRFALNNEDIHYGNRVLVAYSNWLMKKNGKSTMPGYLDMAVLPDMILIILTSLAVEMYLSHKKWAVKMPA